MNFTAEAIAALLPWGPPVPKVTRHGDRLLRTATPTDEFRALWRDHRQVLGKLGVTLNDWRGRPQACWWTEPPAAQVAAKQQRIEASRAVDAEIDIPITQGHAFKGYQRAGVAFALEAFKRYGGALIADEMGLGKTLQAIGIINAEKRIQRVLIVCPNSLKLNWYRELKRFLARSMTIGIGDPKHFPTTDIVIINYDCLYKFEKSLSYYWDLVVLDEAHRCKNPATRAAKAILGYRPTRQERADGMEPKSGIPTRRKLALTGTPIQNRPMEIFSILNWIDPKKWGNRFEFGRRYCDGRRGYGGSWDFSGASNISQLQEELRSGFVVRRLKADVLSELPPKQRQILILPSDGLDGLIAEQRQIEERLSARMAALRAQKSNPVEYEKAVEQLRGSTDEGKSGFQIAHEIGLAKVPLVAEHVIEAMEEGAKIILFAHHRDVIASYVERFKAFNPVFIVGDPDIAKRQRAVDTFQRDDRCRVVVAGIHAAKEGLTLTASSHVVFGEIDWVPGVMNQCEDRAHRIGQASSVLVQHLVLEGSVDVAKVQALIRKQEIIEGALDRREPSARPGPVQPVKPVQPVARPVVAVGQQELFGRLAGLSQSREAVSHGL